jgi:hypothetical protein
MNAETSYNGWTNYQTLVVNLWLDNDGYHEASRDDLEERLRDGEPAADVVAGYAEMMEMAAEEMQPEVTGMYADLLGQALGMVDWREIAESVVGDLAQGLADVLADLAE